MDPASQNLAANVRRLREARGLTQRDLAELSGVPRPTLAHIESGEANPTLHVLVKVAAALASPIEGLIVDPGAPVRRIPRGSLPARARGGVVVRDLIPDPVPGLSFDRSELAPGARCRLTPGGPGIRRFITCERGTLEVEAGEERWGLGSGDLLVAGGEVALTVANAGRGTVAVYTVSAPVLNR